jgi:hypothetical protein
MAGSMAATGKSSKDRSEGSARERQGQGGRKRQDFRLLTGPQ